MRESYQSELAAGLEKRYRTLEAEIMEDVVRRIQKAGKITETADWQLNRTLMLGYSGEDIQKIVSSAVGDNTDEVNRIYEEVIASEYTVYKKQYEEITGEFIAYEDNLQLQQITEAIKRNSTEALTNITKSMGFMINTGSGNVFTPLSDIYNDYLDQAVVDLSSGAFDYNTVIRRTVKQLTDSGLRTSYAFSVNPEDMSGIDYPSGWHNRIDVAARRAVLTGTSQLTGHIVDMNAERLGVKRFEVSWHVGARPDHAEWQGKVYTAEQLRTVCGLGTGAGLLGWNCRHTYYLFFDSSERLYTDEWLARQNAREAATKTFRGKEYNTYQATQKQRQMETEMRAQREKAQLLQAADADPDIVTVEKCKYQAQLDEYRAFSKTFGLPEQTERVYYDLKGRVAPSSKTYAKYTSEMLKRANIDNAMYSRRAAVLGDDTPSLGDFRQWKYKAVEKYNAVERQYQTFKEINAKSWTDSFKDKAKAVYREFKSSGAELSSHAVARILDRTGGDADAVKELIDITGKAANYKQLDGRLVRWYNGNALIQNPETGEYVSYVQRAKEKSEWIKI